ncbi:TPA: BRCT domain-containing protein [Vibrio cholerae]|nr:BRCT domain-containing protein [Vibrio cholerae]ELC0990524.1 BRCT domain-containing protein [Vibrio cholerae]EMA3786718.1 BRCT domain-containing protein [Vibrio cholerae]
MTDRIVDIDEHGQPTSWGINYKRNKEKALKSLQGILSGIQADRRLNPTEVLFLDTWLKTDTAFKKDGDFLDLRDLIEDVLEDGVVEEHELTEIRNLIKDILNYGFRDGWESDGLINQLLGFLQGITADDSINDKEIHALNKMLNSNREVIANWPGDVIHQRLKKILSDGIVDDEERHELLSMLKSICGQQFTDTGCAECFATDYFSDDVVVNSISGLQVCFTGKFFAGNRKSIENKAKELGADVRSDVNKQLDLLVIGSMASRDWIHTSHGRKIESVINNRKSGSSTKILTEQAWLALIGG